MDITVKGKQMDVGDALRTHTEETLSTAVSKYFDRAIDATVVFSKVQSGFHADITVHAGRGITVQGAGEAGDAYPALDVALERIAKQLRRYHRKLVNHHAIANSEVTQAQYSILGQTEEDEVHEEHHPAIVAEMPHEIATMSVSDAVMRLDMGNLPLVMFKNGGHGGLNVVYRRQDGNVGWIDPQTAVAGKAAS
ncbi:ribosome hibernation-promoting factor, HPF/YfiA family [Magnetovibrio blakemorei]|uniref:Ribosome hibernation promoting factor n=1 Tax=Magnetovibrio blakemorei TaxID=28181 RepID=A0A1E5Q329_9PROT|nr:ribosome-associated translation inhibitor RaiA [Magnetovibrio blakemorei]OEJ64015.1 ribosomal subunit interface protein [Magnetovibrio blakemorei]